MAEKMEDTEAVGRSHQYAPKSARKEYASKDDEGMMEATTEHHSVSDGEMVVCEKQSNDTLVLKESTGLRESVHGIIEQRAAVSWQVDGDERHIAQSEEQLKCKADAIDVQLRSKSKEQRIAELEKVEADYAALKEAYQICSNEKSMLQEHCSHLNSKLTKVVEENEELKQSIVPKDKQINILSLKLSDFTSGWSKLHSKANERASALSLKLNEVEKERNFLDSSLSELQSMFEQYQEDVNKRVRRLKEQYRWRIDECMQEMQQLKAIVREQGKCRSSHSAKVGRGEEETITELQREIEELKHY